MFKNKFTNSRSNSLIHLFLIPQRRNSRVNFAILEKEKKKKKKKKTFYFQPKVENDRRKWLPS